MPIIDAEGDLDFYDDDGFSLWVYTHESLENTVSERERGLGYSQQATYLRVRALHDALTKKKIDAKAKKRAIDWTSKIVLEAVQRPTTRIMWAAVAVVILALLFQSRLLEVGAGVAVGFYVSAVLSIRTVQAVFEQEHLHYHNETIKIDLEAQEGLPSSLSSIAVDDLRYESDFLGNHLAVRQKALDFAEGR